jgi:hypothetical protein
MNKTSEKEASRNITLMLIMTSFIYIIGTMPSKIALVISLVNPRADVTVLNTMGVFTLYAFPAVKLFVYIAYNKLFRKQFMDYLKLIKLYK